MRRLASGAHDVGAAVSSTRGIRAKGSRRTGDLGEDQGVGDGQAEPRDAEGGSMVRARRVNRGMVRR